MKTDKPKMQFSKLHVIFADALVAFVWLSSVVLAFLDKQVLSDTAITIITVYGGFATGGYFAQNMVRDTSLNKLEAIKSMNNSETE